MKIAKLNISDFDLVLDWVVRLLVELGEEGDDLGELNREKVLSDWRNAGDRFQIFVSQSENGEITGVLTVIETFAIYANGNYGIINEMYVSPEYRSAGVGAELINAVKKYGKERGWTRIDVTAPESERWAKTRRFYEKQGFAFTGPKLKILL
jgi:GNAT superfamily N-acetyltransferase